jgi:hypothetical protein
MPLEHWQFREQPEQLLRPVDSWPEQVPQEEVL